MSIGRTRLLMFAYRKISVCSRVRNIFLDQTLASKMLTASAAVSKVLPHLVHKYDFKIVNEARPYKVHQQWFEGWPTTVNASRALIL